MKKKTNKINKIKRYIKGWLLLGIATTSLLYIAYIATVATVQYLSNRPIRTAVLFAVFGCLLIVWDTIQDNRQQQQARQQARQLKRRQQQLLQQNRI